MPKKSIMAKIESIRMQKYIAKVRSQTKKLIRKGRLRDAAISMSFVATSLHDKAMLIEDAKERAAALLRSAKLFFDSGLYWRAKRIADQIDKSLLSKYQKKRIDLLLEEVSVRTQKDYEASCAFTAIRLACAGDVRRLEKHIKLHKLAFHQTTLAILRGMVAMLDEKNYKCAYLCKQSANLWVPLNGKN